MTLVKPPASDEAVRKRMAAVRRSGTAPERVVGMLLDRLCATYTANDASLPGRPDFYVPLSSLAILVHGCFWHRHKGCAAASMPKTHKEYWAAKFRDNIRRDQRVKRQLKSLGIRPMVVWQCQTSALIPLRRRLRRALTPIRI